MSDSKDKKNTVPSKETEKPKFTKPELVELTIEALGPVYGSYSFWGWTPPPGHDYWGT